MRERRLRVFENRVLSRILGPKRDEVTGEWIKLHNEDLSDLYSCSDDQTEKKEMGWTCSTWGRVKDYEGFWWGNSRENDNLRDPGLDDRVILRRIFRK
jgi:hypothetical protein